MEYLADELGVAVLKLPALQRELSPRADARQSGRCAASCAHADQTSFTPTRRRPARPDGWPHCSPGGRPRAVVHTYHGHVLSGYFGRRRERIFRLSSGSSAEGRERSSP